MQRAQITPCIPPPLRSGSHSSPRGLSPAAKTSGHLHTCCLPSCLQSGEQSKSLFNSYLLFQQWPEVSPSIWNPIRGPGGTASVSHEIYSKSGHRLEPRGGVTLMLTAVPVTLT